MKTSTKCPNLFVFSEANDMMVQNPSAHPFYSEPVMHENTHPDASITVEGGMSRDYVSLSVMSSQI